MTFDVSGQIDFDAWKRLAKDDPEEFERVRELQINKAIEHIALHEPDRKLRLERLQFRVNLEREKAKTPFAAYMNLSSMFYESFMGDDGLLDKMRNMDKIRAQVRREMDDPEICCDTSCKAKVLDFGSKGDHKAG